MHVSDGRASAEKNKGREFRGSFVQVQRFKDAKTETGELLTPSMLFVRRIGSLENQIVHKIETCGKPAHAITVSTQAHTHIPKQTLA